MHRKPFDHAAPQRPEHLALVSASMLLLMQWRRSTGSPFIVVSQLPKVLLAPISDICAHRIATKLVSRQSNCNHQNYCSNEFNHGFPFVVIGSITTTPRLLLSISCSACRNNKNNAPASNLVSWAGALLFSGERCRKLIPRHLCKSFHLPAQALAQYMH